MAIRLGWITLAASLAGLAALVATVAPSADVRLERVLATPPAASALAYAPPATAHWMAALARAGFRDFTAPRRKGAHVVVEATGRRGERLTIVADAHTGEITGLRRRAK